MLSDPTTRNEWRRRYEQAFVRDALNRPGWTRENAEVWASEISDDAAASCWPHQSPEEVAPADVLECEKESYNEH